MGGIRRERERERVRFIVDCFMKTLVNFNHLLESAHLPDYQMFANIAADLL